MLLNIFVCKHEAINFDSQWTELECLAKRFPSVTDLKSLLPDWYLFSKKKLPRVKSNQDYTIQL